MGIGAVALAGCGSSSGTFGATAPSSIGTAAAAANNDQPSQQSSQQSSGQSPNSANAGAGQKWVITAPNTLFGFQQIQPSAAIVDKVQNDLATHSASIGVSGTPVIAVYDDPTHDVYLIFAGYNGGGFDPARMASAYQTLPVHTEDGAGDHVVINNMVIDPGAHGGSAGCQSTLIETGGLAAEGTLCSWLTTTTLGSITYYPKPDHLQTVTGTGPEVMGKVMRDLRDQVEHRA
jgi:hypothetical protein